MKRFLLAGIGMLALTAALPASAADLPRVPYKVAPAYAPPPAYSWTGFYLGINGGYGWGSSDWAGMGVTNSPSGGMIGGTIGYNWQTPSRWVWGLEGDLDWAGFNNSSICQFGASCETRSTWFGTGRARVGYGWDRVMPYVTGGVAFGNIEATQSAFGSVSDTNVGWTVGAGIEAAIAPQWTAKVEYLYADLGSTNCSFPTCSSSSGVDLRMNMLRGGLNYRFFSSPTYY